MNVKLNLPPADEYEARQLLESICWSYNSYISRIDCNQVLKILEAFPYLASENYGHNRYHHARRPLMAYLLRNNVTLEQLQSIYILNSDCFPTNGSRLVSNGETLLHVACEYQCSEDIIRFIADKSPVVAISTCNSHGYLPIQCLIKSRKSQHVSFDIIQRFLVAYPKYHPAQYVLDDEFDPLAMVISFGYDDQVFEFILNKIPENKQDLGIGWRNEAITITEEMSRRIDRVLALPQIHRLRCSPCEWTQAGFVALMQSLKCHAQSLTSINLMLPRDILSTSHLAQKSLEACLGISGALKQLELHHGCGNSNDAPGGHIDSNDNASIQAVSVGLRSNSGIESLTLTDFCLSNAELFRDIVFKGPRSLRLNDITLLGDEWTRQTTSKRGVSFSTLTNLSVRGCVMSPACWLQLLHLLEGVSTLEELAIVHSRGERAFPSRPGQKVNITDSLLPLLTSNRLKVLEVLGENSFDVDIESVCASMRLQGNTALKTYSVATSLDTASKQKVFAEFLREDNATIESLKSLCEDDFPSIKYWLSLNRIGRSFARNPETTKESFINLLCNVPVKKCHGAQYGLLRECPSLWSQEDNTSSDRPRKRKWRPLID